MDLIWNAISPTGTGSVRRHESTALAAARPADLRASGPAPEMTGMRLSKGFAMAAEDIRHLQSRSHGTRSAGWHDFQAEPIERARRVADRFGGDSGVARRA